MGRDYEHLLPSHGNLKHFAMSIYVAQRHPRLILRLEVRLDRVSCMGPLSHYNVGSQDFQFRRQILPAVPVQTGIRLASSFLVLTALHYVHVREECAHAFSVWHLGFPSLRDGVEYASCKLMR